MDREIEAVKSAILARGLEDWVHIADVAFVARQARFGDRLMADYPTGESMKDDQLVRRRDDWLAWQEREALSLGIKAIKGLLRDEQIRVGETASGQFVAWAGSVQELESRVDLVAEAATYPVLPGDLFWIENTPMGDQKAASEIDRRQLP